MNEKYTPLYCSKEAIALKLRGRLNIKPDRFQNAPYSREQPNVDVDDRLVNLLIEQEEGKLSYILGQIYQMPLLNKHPILEEITESLVISELMKIHYQGQGYIGVGGDLAGLGNDLKMNAMGLIQMITAGHQIFIPGFPALSTMPGQPPPKPVFLPGEALLENFISNDTLSRVYTYVRKKDDLIDNPHNFHTTFRHVYLNGFGHRSRIENLNEIVDNLRD